jgi:4-amino-4-deoxy-L-arabinose transferase-like glycosyltransferase
MMMRLIHSMGQGRGGLFVGLGLFLALVAMSWVGFIGSDDATYAKGAYGWIDAFPGLYVGGHGTIRYLITIPTALSLTVFGENSFGLVLPCLLYTLAFMILAWRAVRDAAGYRHATMALLVLAISPLLVIQSSISGVDVIEMCYLFASVFFFWRCLDQGPDTKRLLLAGAMAGCAFLTRETAIFIAVFYALFFLVGHRFHRKYCLWIAVGFLGVWGLELLYLWAMTGDPLYRFHISLHHDSTINRNIDLAGNVIVNPLLDPLLVLLVNQEFMALFFLAVPLGAWMCFGGSIAPRIRYFARIIALFGITWFVCAGAAQKLLPLNPRYFMITCAAACMLTGMALAQIDWKKRSWLWPLGLFAVLAGGNFLGIYVENKDSVFAERTVARLAAQYPDKVMHTDPATRLRSKILLRWEKAQDRVIGSKPGPGMLFVHNPISTEKPNPWMTAADLPAYVPQANWRKVESFEPDAPYAAQLIEAMGLDQKLPQGIWRKLRYRHPVVTLYEIPA